MFAYDKPLPVGKTGNYLLVVDPGWLGDESIVQCTVTPSAEAQVVGTQTDGEGVEVLVTGVTAGRATLHFEWATASRSDCITGYVTVINC